MAKMGRPRHDIPKDEFENLCAIQCTEEEIAAWFKCSVDTIERWCKREYKRTFADVFNEKRKPGLISLRRAQFKRAVDDGDKTLLIWLGKQLLGQKEQPVEQDTTTLDAVDCYTSALRDAAKSAPKPVDHTTDDTDAVPKEDAEYGGGADGSNT